MNQTVTPVEDLDRLLGIAEQLERLIWDLSVELDRICARSMELLEQLEHLACEQKER